MDADRLIREAQSGNGRALDELCRREWRPVYGLLYAYLGDRAEAEDATQEVFLRALRSFDGYRHRGHPFRTYLKTIARNLLRDRWRRKAPHTGDLADEPEPVADDPGPEDQLVADDTRQSIERLLNTLNPDQQAVIRLRILEERSTDEVAAMLDRTPNAIRQLQHRALTSLRARIEEGARI
jgi:RNA polymerase sigma-70 factor, ECF subfamily